MRLKIDSNMLLDLLAQVRAIEEENINLREQAASAKRQGPKPPSEEFEINIDKLEE